MFKLSPIRWGIMLFLLGDILIAGVAGFWFYRQHQQLPKVHFHAGFQVYVDGQLQDFSDIKYMNTTPCAERHRMGEPKASAAEIQMEKAHLHDGIGNVVHVHVDGGVWRDLFKNIHYDISSKGSIQGYIAGQPVKDILKYPIKSYDSVIILVGKNEEIFHYLPNAVTKETIVKAENMSETCGKE